MSDTLSPKGQFKPIHQAHSIEQVVFVLQFDQALDNNHFAKVLKSAEQFKSEFPTSFPIQKLTFVLGAGAPNQSDPTNSGTSFQKTGVDGLVINELRVDRSSLTFITTFYSRWATVWSQASRYFDALVPLYAECAGLAGISVNYVDKFLWEGSFNDCKPSLLVRAGSKYLCPHVYDAEDFWHSHTGAFTRPDANTRRLLNVNVDYLDETRINETRRIVAITTVLTDQLNQPGYTPISLKREENIDFIKSHMLSLHLLGKEVFGNIINDTMSSQIDLKL
jgi:uncharacterized protein (TIGR04255 family)